MLQLTPQMRILVAVEAVDFRKGIDSLAALCRQKLDADPFSGWVFVFRSRSATSIKVLVYDGQGFWLAQKRLSKGRFGWWPEGSESTQPIEAHQAQLLLAAGNPAAAAAPMWRPVSLKTGGLRSKQIPSYCLLMETACRYRGRVVTAQDVAFIREWIAAHPEASRRALSSQLCEAWQWRQANGAPRDMVCRGLLLRLDRAGLIELPPVRKTPPNPLARRARPAPVLVDTTPLAGPLERLRPLDIQPVRRTAEEALFNSLLEQYHYLGYEQPVGEHLKYLVWAGGALGARPVACAAFASAPRHLGCRDRFIGWSAQARRRNLHLIAYNTRWLILPWVAVPHLASHLLSRMTRRVSEDWQRVYGHPIHFLETFVDPERFRGTCYRAANWVVLGRTTGRGKDDHTHRPNRSIKKVLGLPLTPRFRQLLQEA